MSKIINRADKLLEACRQPLFKQLLVSARVPTPVDLDRGDGLFRWPMIAGYAVRVVSLTGASALTSHLGSVSQLPPSYPTPAKRPQRIIFDMTGVTMDNFTEFATMRVKPVISSLTPNSRLLFASMPAIPDSNGIPSACVGAGLNSFVRSLAKEVGGRGCTANNVQIRREAEITATDALKQCIDAMCFFLTPDSAFVSGQTISMKASRPSEWVAAGTTLRGKSVLVTGAARGIGAAIARRLAAEGARIIAVDNWMQSKSPSSAAIGELYGAGSVALALDITSNSAPAKILNIIHDHCEHQQVDIVVHNAGITRDKTLKNMPSDAFQKVVDVNLQAIQTINEFLGVGSTQSLAVRNGGRVIVLSSINGIAGAAGQTNYAYTKGALMGYMEQLCQHSSVRDARITTNAIAPGFIETDMVADMPFLLRNIGRRSNALFQGGLPEDIAALAAFLSTAEAQVISGETIRACGCNMVGR